MSDSDADVVRVRKAVSELGEHFDSVQIFCTRHESGEHEGTLKFTLGEGNWFARYGQVREWLIVQDEGSRENARDNHSS